MKSRKRNPLFKRLLRELKEGFGKYLVIFIFMCGMIGIVSGFLVTNESVRKSYKNSFEINNIEDGNFTLANEASPELLRELEKNNIKIYKNYHFDEKTKEIDSTLRVFVNRSEINITSVFTGKIPNESNEIAIDRLYAKNNNLNINDVITINNKELIITGFVALPDYSCLYSSPSDMLFDTYKFGIGVMTQEGYNKIGSINTIYVYSWKYNDELVTDKEKAKKAEELMNTISNNTLLTYNYITDFTPAYLNPAINFVGDDVSSDNVSMTLFLYLVMINIAFVFAIMTINTINKEANVIGTLRASGYSKQELVMHYMFNPMIVVLIGCVAGNILGYTMLKDYLSNMYYGIYSIKKFDILFNASAFIKTTIIPIIIMFLINFIILEVKLNISPLKFIRRDLKKNSDGKVLKLNKKLNFKSRFRIRILLQNIPNYIMIFLGIFLANVIIFFGFSMTPVFEHYQENIVENKLCEYQYILKTEVDTSNIDAEKYCIDTFKINEDGSNGETVTVYGIKNNSKFFKENITDKIYISDAYSKKYHVKVNDTIYIKKAFEETIYSFKVDGIYTYPSQISVFMSKQTYNNIFGNTNNYFNGYLSNEELNDIDKVYIYNVITEDDLTKTSRLMLGSIEDVITMFSVFGVIMFILIIYLLSKIIIEKNTQSISMVKILGYNKKEIGELYIISTAIVVLFAIIVSIPLADLLMSILIPYAMSRNSGYLAYYSSFNTYMIVFALGVLSYTIIAFFQYLKIDKIKKNDALKNIE